MPVFYRGRRALITQDIFERAYVGRLQYTIKDLADVRIIRHGPDTGSGVRILGLSALVAAFLVVPIVGPESKLLAGLAAGVLLIGSLASVRRRQPVRWELMATYQGRPVVLFESVDQVEFDQVCRALQRAIERRSGHR